MELTGELKDKVSKCETKEQVKEQIKNAGMILTDEELDGISGGVNEEQRTVKNPVPMTPYTPRF